MTEQRFKMILKNIDEMLVDTYKEIWKRRIDNAKKQEVYKSDDEYKPTKEQLINNCKLALHYEGFTWDSFSIEERKQIQKLISVKYNKLNKIEGANN